MVKEFDKEQFIRNIDALIKQKHLKIGEVEKAAGLSAGYLSRYRKSESDAAPSVEWVWKLAQFLDVSVDLLISGNFDGATDNIQYLTKFIRELKQRTDDNEVEWSSHSIRSIQNAMELDDITHDGVLKKADEAVYQKDITEVLNSSSLFTTARSSNTMVYPGTKFNGKARVYGDAYELEFVPGTWVALYRLQTKLTDNPLNIPEALLAWSENYSLFFRKNEVSHYDPYEMSEPEYEPVYSMICNTIDNRVLFSSLQALYQSIRRHETDVKISDETRTAIDAFLNPPDPNDPNNLPF